MSDDVSDDVAMLRDASHRALKTAAAASKDWRVDVVGPLGAAAVLRHNRAVANLWRDAAHADLWAPDVARYAAVLLDAFADDMESSPDAWEGTAMQEAAVEMARAILGRTDG